MKNNKDLCVICEVNEPGGICDECWPTWLDEIHKAKDSVPVTELVNHVFEQTRQRISSGDRSPEIRNPDVDRFIEGFIESQSLKMYREWLDECERRGGLFWGRF